MSVVIMMIALTGCTTTILPKRDGIQTDYAGQFEAARKQLQIAEPAARANKQPLVLAHYMPWYEAPPVSEQYGFHWHQGGSKFDPYTTLPDGRAVIASHYYPLTGPYDSKDTAVLEYQAALMKMCGIDGVIFDWYGIKDALDYKSVHEATIAMVSILKKYGLKFAICYEDQTIKHMIEGNFIAKTDAVDTAKEAFTWLQEHWFLNENYVKRDGRPLVLDFGPQFFTQKTEWEEIWTNVDPKPFFADIDNRTNFADATFNWPPMYLSSGGKLAIPRLITYLNNFYEKQNGKPFLIGTVFPEFHDIYAQAGGKSYGFLDYSDGETFKLTYDAVEKAHPDVIQVTTWNDYGEGTCVEPTIERGYASLEHLQDIRKKWDLGFTFNYTDLRIPIELYRIMVGEDDEKKQQVKEIYTAIFDGDAEMARNLTRSVGIDYDFSVHPILRDARESSQKEIATVFDPGGKKNLALGRPVVVSSRIYDFTGQKAVDGDLSSYWEGASDKYPADFTVDLISSVKLSIAVVKLNPQRIWGKRSQTIEVLVSNDNETFTTLVPTTDYVFDPSANGNTIAIPLDTQARYIRLIFTANTGAKSGQIAEFEVYGE
ncbi:MAG: discoidin domain-containing protein [Treponema sp.]|nr:discoidin domain-containing protein [Treponema sp.]